MRVFYYTTIGVFCIVIAGVIIKGKSSGFCFVAGWVSCLGYWVLCILADPYIAKRIKMTSKS